MYQVLFTSAEITAAVADGSDSALTRPIDYTAGQTLVLENESAYALFVLYGPNQIDYMKPNSYLVMPMGSPLYVKIDTTAKSDLTQPFAYIGYKNLQNAMPYAKGSTTFGGGLTISGAVDVTGSTINANVSGPITLAAGTTVDANIQNAQINTQVVNTTTAPVYNQDSLGSFATLENVDTAVNFSGSNPTTTLISSASGGYIQTMDLTISNTSAVGPFTFSIYNGSQVIATGSAANNASWEKQFNFGTGVANNGITIVINTLFTGNTGTAVGTAAIVQNAAPGVPKNLA